MTPSVPGRLDEQIDKLDDRELVFTPETLSIAGAVLTIGRVGKTEILRGLVRPEDIPRKKGKDKKSASGDAAGAEKLAGPSASLVENRVAA